MHGRGRENGFGVCMLALFKFTLSTHRRWAEGVRKLINKWSGARVIGEDLQFSAVLVIILK